MTNQLARLIAGRRRLLGWAAVLILVVLGELVMLTWALSALTLSLLWITAPLFTGAVLANRALAGHRRAWLDRELGMPVADGYRPLPATGWWARFTTALRDPATWRDMRWMLVDMTAGLVLLAVPVIAFAAGALSLTLPLLWLLLPDGAALDYPFGATVEDTVDAVTIGVPWGIACLAVFWLFTPVVMRAYGRLTAALLRPGDRWLLTERVEHLASSRAQTVDAQAGELRRIERDLHDGAQAHLVALGMSLGMVENLVRHDPAARELLAEARAHNAQAISELRALITGLRPQVLNDRGLIGAVESLALRIPLPIDIELDVPGRLPEPVETAAYFTISEALANTVKHSGATRAWVRGSWADDMLRLQVGDNGRGGAVVRPGGGLDGIRQRLAAFDGVLTPAPDPVSGTTLVIEVPVPSP
ncbi:putative two-component system sensor kinase [Actinoplanes missouriensis 431]|uniref:histidine kinase n=1 Tax=Actinoplanes missouriensis (strain ATCC 14538 / DSM 43046 / CBS 188.64 / JCM 3121 / NBRC 102363 / NCIMB 12654 / NRRL B-3342 / UNCC 431) TaxID=512565 RepID=I0H4D6_ACTM4|nr:sensor domain-containing protein [Actinoplanes missouriensis]BAL87873.1 putative two-component system sensor kinase [Actinoplanes missouriensis 431]